jgi:hypothetical protein
MKPTTAEKLGVNLAYEVKWDGQAICAAFLAALEDANFHDLREQLEPIINQHLEG